MFKLAFLDGSHHHNQLEGAGVLSQTVLTCNFQLPQNRYTKVMNFFFIITQEFALTEQELYLLISSYLRPWIYQLALVDLN